MTAAHEKNGSGDALEWLTSDKLLELIAHDINNLCHASMSYLDLAMDPGATPEMRAKFGALSRELIRRASTFTPSLRVVHDLRSAVLSPPSPPLEEALHAAPAAALERRAGSTLALTT